VSSLMSALAIPSNRGAEVLVKHFSSKVGKREGTGSSHAV